MDQVDLARIAGEEVGLLDCRVATAHDRQDFAFEEGAVTYRAVGDAATGQLLLAGHLQLAGQPARGHDQGRGPQFLTAGRPDHFLAVFGRDRLHLGELAQVKPELAGVFAHLDRQVGAQDRLEARVVLDQLGVEQLPAQRAAVEEDSLQVHAGGV